jgi:hypothetical protein
MQEFEATVISGRFQKNGLTKANLRFKGGYTLRDWFVCDGKIRPFQKVKVQFTTPHITILP